MKRGQSENRVRKAAHDLLVAERAATEAQIESLTQDFTDMVAASAASNADDEHDPEGSTIAFERAQVSSLLEHEHARLEEVDAALARVSDGSYGTCTSCGQPIPAERLEARPTAATCIDCARQAGA